MRTNKYIKLHTRCITVCELIQQADGILSRTEDFVVKEKKKPWARKNDFALKRCEYDKNKYTAIRERLIKWYSDIFERLQSETSEFRTPNWLKGIHTENIGTLQPAAPNDLAAYTTDIYGNREQEDEVLRLSILTGKP